MDIKEDIDVAEVKVDDQEVETNTLQIINQRINEELAAIESYTQDLNNDNFTEDEKKIITEIMNDEKDHLILLTAMMQDRVGESDEFPENISESITMTELYRDDDFNKQILNWIKINLDLSEYTQDKDGSYLYSLSNSKEFGKIYSKLDKNNGVTELKSFSMVTDDYSSIYFKRIGDPKFIINLQADFIANDYSLIVTRE